MNFAAALLLLVSAGFPASTVSEAPIPKEPKAISLHGNCRYHSASGTDAVSKVKDVVRRFNAAVACKDKVTAELFVDTTGTFEEVEEFKSDDGQTVQTVQSASWPEQLFLFTRPGQSEADGDHEDIVQGEPSILIDGKSALVRQLLWTNMRGNPSTSNCLVEHLMLVKLASDWKIRRMMLIHHPDSCPTPPVQP